MVERVRYPNDVKFTEALQLIEKFRRICLRNDQTAQIVPPVHFSEFVAENIARPNLGKALGMQVVQSGVRARSTIQNRWFAPVLAGELADVIDQEAWANIFALFRIYAFGNVAPF